MAGFAVSLRHLAKYPNATMPYKAGYEEDAFLKSIGLKFEDIEPKANDCKEVYVWHTQTTKKKPPLIKVAGDVLEETKSNLYALLKSLGEMGVSHFSGSAGELNENSFVSCHSGNWSAINIQIEHVRQSRRNFQRNQINPNQSIYLKCFPFIFDRCKSHCEQGWKGQANNKLGSLASTFIIPRGVISIR